MARYAALQELGSGGFGEVYRCKRTEDGEIFARKILRVADEDSLKRFQREVRMLSKLDHPRIITIVGKNLSAAQPWYVMPLYKGSLAAEFPGIVGNGERIRRVFGAVIEGIQYAHEQGVLHRDLKPANILLNSDDDVVISDFGLGRSLDALTTRVTVTGNRFGTPGYTAPEQAMNAKLSDERSDIFSLGRILYELYTGDNPSAVQDLTKVPPGIALIIDRCTKTDPARRFQSVADLRLAFGNLFVAGDKKTDEDKIKEFVAKALAEGSLRDRDVANLGNCIARRLEDADLLHDLCVRLPESVFKLLWENNPHVVRCIVEAFTTQVADQSWGFDYVDTLGNACVKIFNSIRDPQVRAMVAYAIVDVSVGHNRYRVMDQAAELLMAARSPEEDLAIAEALSPIASKVGRIKGRLNKGKLGPNVAALLRTEDE